VKREEGTAEERKRDARVLSPSGSFLWALSRRRAGRAPAGAPGLWHVEKLRKARAGVGVRGREWKIGREA
jgi:hypothetical protein